MDISIHEVERLERSGRRFMAAAILAALTMIAATWWGLMTFLGSASAWGTVEGVRSEWIPDVESLVLDLPDISSLSEVYTADGVLLGKLNERNSQPLPLDEIPNLVIGAVLSAEDGEFMDHNGIDYRGVARAFIDNVGGGARQGGSTITQQIVKANFIGTEATLKRKVSEAAIAIELERRFTKEQLLEFYLNSVFFGNNAYGVKAAAEVYFGKDLADLTIAEAAALPVPIRNPSLYDLRRGDEITVKARDAVIDEMVDEGYITEAEGEAAKATSIVVAPPAETPDPAPQVLIAAKDAILNDPLYGLGATYLQRKRAVFGCPAYDTECEGGGGLKIFVTVDLGLQQQALDILQTWLPAGADGPTGAIAMVDNATGATVVMATGLEFGTDIEAGQRQYDLATKGRRNAGSSFKPFGLIAALEQGIPLNSFWDMTTPQFLDFGGVEPWECNNAGTNSPQIRSLEDALIYSTNTVFCQVSVTVGGGAIRETAQRMGIKSPLGDFPSIVLGAYEVSPLEMAAAFSTIANQGIRVENYLIERIEDADGNVVYQHQVDERRVIEAAIAAATTNTMELAVSRGTGGRAVLNPTRPQAGKTGTHEHYTDAWFVGFIPQYTTSIWVGFPDSQVEMRNITVNGVFIPTAFGGSVAAPIWREFMQIVTRDLPIQDFAPDPDGIGVYYQTPRVRIPDVIGMDIEDAEEELLQAGFEVTITVVNSEEDEDTVVATDPPEGELTRQGTTVEVEVSSGIPPETILPDLIGQSRSVAVAALTRLRAETEIQFSWNLVFVETTDRSLNNTVASTTPGPGATITEESVITLRIYQLNRDGG
ncbi:MAG: transglycosylase domain-containing protein [Actinobacteria bacterium]|nr:transglycosylase domain-containing protein [Actinomycetota bacterium]